MWRRVTLSFVLLAGASLLWAQGNRRAYYKPVKAMTLKERYLQEMKILMDEQIAFSAPAPVVKQAPIEVVNNAKVTQGITVANIGSSSNAFSIITNIQNQVFTLPEYNLVGFVHRNCICDFNTVVGVPGGIANGILRIDVSLDNGGTWNNNLGPLTPLNSNNPENVWIRYPSGTVILPPGMNNVDSAIVVVFGASHDGASWGDAVWGKTNNVSGLQAGPIEQDPANPVNPSVTWRPLWRSDYPNIFIPRGSMVGLSTRQVFYLLDHSFDGANFGDSIFLWIGTFSGDTMIWTRSSFKPGVNIDANGDARFGGYAIAFDPTEKHGWICIEGDYDQDGDPTIVEPQFERQPILYHSGDTGKTWNGPIVVDLRSFSGLVDSLKYIVADTDQNGVLDTIWFTGIPYMIEWDMVVDYSGNPHIFCDFVNALTTNPDSADWISVTVHVLGEIWTEDFGNTWKYRHIAYLTCYDGYTYYDAANPDPQQAIRWASYVQASRSADGRTLACSWVDDTSLTNPNWPTRSVHDLWVYAEKVGSGGVMDYVLPTDMSAIIRAIPNLPSGIPNAFNFPTAAPVMLKGVTPPDTGYYYPVVFTTTASAYIQNNAAHRVQWTYLGIGLDGLVSSQEQPISLPNVVVNVYPNPVKEVLTVQVKRKGTVVLYDLQGRQLLQAAIENGLAKLSMQELPAGVYLLKVTTTEGVVTKRIIKR